MCIGHASLLAAISFPEAAFLLVSTKDARPQCQNADESKSDWLLKFTGSLRVRSFKTGNENVLPCFCFFCWTFSITPETDSGKEIRKLAMQTNKESKCKAAYY